MAAYGPLPAATQKQPGRGPPAGGSTGGSDEFRCYANPSGIRKK